MSFNAHTLVNADLPVQTPVYPIDIQIEEGATVETAFKLSAIEKWKVAAATMASLNTISADAIRNISLLYDSNSSVTFLSDMLNPACVVKTYSIYILNDTEIQSFLCCHFRKLRYPALQHVISKMYNDMHGVQQTTAANALEPVLLNLQEIKEIDTLGIRVAKCMDYNQVSRQEQNIIRAENAMTVVELLIFAYSQIQDDYKRLSVCLLFDMDTSGCMRNTTFTYTEIKPNLKFSEIDANFANVCSLQALIQFESFRHTVVCA